MVIRAMLWPTFALVVLILFVGLTLLLQRVAQLRRQPPTRADFATVAASRAYFQSAERPAANLANLFELPVLYFALVPLLLLTGLVGVAQVVLAWTYVALRAAHSIAHLTGRLRLRLILFVASFAVLTAMWLTFAIDVGFSAR